VILGCPYDYRIDVWSLGCILFELYTGNVLFQNNSVQELLTRVLGICGPLSEEVHRSGRHTNKFFTKEKMVYQEVDEERNIDNRHLSEEMIELIKMARKNKKKVKLYVPKQSSLRHRMHSNDQIFVDFIKCLLDPDKDRRPTVAEALRHPFITECKYEDGL
jgi:serine/threonine protein kinase